MSYLYSPWQGPTVVREETFHPPSLGALTARLQHGVLTCGPLLLAPGTLIFLCMQLLSHYFAQPRATPCFAGQPLSVLDVYLPLGSLWGT